VIKTQIPLFIAVILGGYILLYRFDLSRPFHLCKRATWNEVFRALGLPFVKREKKTNVVAFALLFLGLVLSVLALFLPSLESFVLQFVGALVVIFALPSFLGMPASASHVEILPYPRKASACISSPSVFEASVSSVSLKSAEPTFRMFYFGLKDAHVMSLPETDTPFIDQLIAFIEASKKRAFVQIYFQEIHPQQYLEVFKWRLLNEKGMLQYKPLPLMWASTLDERLKKVNELLSSNVFAISIFGIVEGDPYEIHATASDEIDHLVVFETQNPALFYWLVKHERPSFTFPNYFGTRVEPSFFFATPRTLPSFLTLPSTGRTLMFLSEKIEEIKPWGVESEAPTDVLEVTFIPKDQKEQKLLAFPKRGVVDIYFDGSKLHIFVSGDASKYFKQNGAVLENTKLAFDSWFKV